MKKIHLRAVSLFLAISIVLTISGVTTVFAESIETNNLLVNENNPVINKTSESSLDSPSENTNNQVENVDKFTYLSDLNWKSVVSADYIDNKLPTKDKSFDQDVPQGQIRPLNLYGKNYSKGIGAHAGHFIVYDLKGMYTSFTALIGPDNNCNTTDPMGVMGLKIYADGQEVYNSGAMSIRKPNDTKDVSLDVSGVNELKFEVTPENGKTWSDVICIVDPKLYYEEPNLQNILVNGQSLEGYYPTVYEYTVKLPTGASVPTITTQTKAGITAIVSQANAVPGIATVTLGEKIYRILFSTGSIGVGGAFSSFNIQMPQGSALQGVGIIKDKDIYVTIPEDMDKTQLKAVFKTGSINDNLTVNGTLQKSGETVNNFTKSVKYIVENENGFTTYNVFVGSWKNIPGYFYDGDATGKPERPYVHDYTKTLTMKMFLSIPSANGSDVALTFDEALNMIKQVDSVTRGMPKIFYLVGWQYTGHDDKYPAWGEVNPALKCKNCTHANSTECLKWLMNEAYKYNSTVSLHINSTDAYKDSPLWNEYVNNDLISKKLIGSLMVIGKYNGEDAYQVNYKNEWESGYYKKRVDALLNMLPIQRAGTIHMDAFFARSSKQSTLREEQEARLKMIRYWRDCGVDLTSEFLYNSNGSSESNTGGNGTGLIGIIPMTWHFNQNMNTYITRKASVAVGGGINTGSTFGNEAEDAEILFGRSMWGEDLMTGVRKVGPLPNWDSEFTRQFCTQTVPWSYQNQFDRLSLNGSGNNRIATYSNGLVASLANRTLTKDGKLIRQNDDIFVPSVWSKKSEIIAYSEIGYTNKTWSLPDNWLATKYDVFSVSKDGLVQLIANAAVPTNKEIKLTLGAKQMVIVVPSGDIVLTKPMAVSILSPVNNETGINLKTANLSWGATENSISYEVTIAEDVQLTKNVVRKTTTDTSISASQFRLLEEKLYYWKVTAKSANGETVDNKGGVHNFTTALTLIPEIPSQLIASRYNNNLVRLTWKDTGLSYHYNIYRRLSGNQDFNLLGTVVGCQYDDITAPKVKDKIYEYKISAINTLGDSTDSYISFADHEIYISDMNYASMIHDGSCPPKNNLNINNNPISMKNISFDKGLAIHANSEVVYNLNGSYTSFKAVLGTDDENVRKKKPTSIKCYVYVDNVLKYQSDLITIHTGLQEINIDVTGATNLKLVVDKYDNSYDSDWSIWGSARLTQVTTTNKEALTIND